MWILQAARMQVGICALMQQGLMPRPLAQAYIELVNEAEHAFELMLVSLCIERRPVEA